MMRTRSLLVAALLTTLVSSCALLPTGSKKRADNVYLIAPALAPAPAQNSGRCGVIQVAAGSVATGQRGTNMVYTLSDYEVSYFAYARWGDAPARMLATQMRAALRASDAFSGVLASPVAAHTDYQLELADVSVIQRFDSEEASRLEMNFEERLFDGDRRHLIAAQPLRASVDAGGDAQRGVAAANDAAGKLLQEAREFVLARCGRNEL